MSSFVSNAESDFRYNRTIKLANFLNIIRHDPIAESSKSTFEYLEVK